MVLRAAARAEAAAGRPRSRLDDRSGRRATAAGGGSTDWARRGIARWLGAEALSWDVGDREHGRARRERARADDELPSARVRQTHRGSVAPGRGRLPARTHRPRSGRHGEPAEPRAALELRAHHIERVGYCQHDGRASGFIRENRAQQRVERRRNVGKIAGSGRARRDRMISQIGIGPERQCSRNSCYAITTERVTSVWGRHAARAPVGRVTSVPNRWLRLCCCGSLRMTLREPQSSRGNARRADARGCRSDTLSRLRLASTITAECAARSAASQDWRMIALT